MYTSAKAYTGGKGLGALLSLLVLLAALCSLSARAQSSEGATYTMVLRGVPLEEALEELVAATQINLVYNSELVGEARVFCAVRDASAEALLRCVLREAGLDFYQTSSGTYVLTESIRKRPLRGRLIGVVVDEETGEPVPYANVLLADAGTGTTANEAGLFSLSSLVAGTHRVVVTHVGYETVVDSISVIPDGSTRQRVALRERPVTAEPIVVNGLQQRLPSQGLGRGELDRERLATPSGVGTADVARSTSSLLGVALQEPMADLHIQGGDASEHQVRLDGIPVRNPVTLGRLLGALSPLAIERLTVHKAGFGAEHGSRLSGIVAADHALNSGRDEYASVQIDPLSVNGKVHGKKEWAGGVQSEAMAAVRTSLWDVYRDPGLDRLLQRWRSVDPLLLSERLGREVEPSAFASEQRRTDVAFSDVHAAARVRLPPFHTFYTSLYRGHNRVDAASLTIDPEAEATADAPPVFMRDQYHWTNWTGQLRYQWMPGARALGTLRLYRSQQSLGHGHTVAALDDTGEPSAPDRYPAPYDGNRVSETGLQAELEYSMAARHHLSGALEVMRLASRALVGDGFFRPLAYEHEAWQVAAYAEDEVSLGLQTVLEAGTRLTYLPVRHTVYAEPRLAVRHDGTHDALGPYAVRLAGGLYRQFTNRFELSSPGPTALAPTLRFWLPPDRSLAPPRAYHLAAEALLKPMPGWQLNLESYYKWQPHLLAVNYPALLEGEGPADQPLRQADFIAPSRGRAFGGGFRLRHTGSRLQGTLGYSYSRSERIYPGRFEGQMKPVPWNQPHRLSAEGQLRLTSALSAGLSWRGAWGRRWAFRQAYYDYLALQAPAAYAPFDLSDPSAHTLSPFYRLDGRLSYARTWKDFSVQIHLDLINVLDRQNTFDWSLQQGESGIERADRTMPGRRLLLSVSIGY